MEEPNPIAETRPASSTDSGARGPRLREIPLRLIIPNLITVLAICAGLTGVRLAFENLNAVLKAADCTFDDVVDVTVFIVNPEAQFETIWQVFGEHWGEAPYPTLTGVGVTWLYGAQFEIKVIARLPEASAAA